jgi:hypothetical protein
MATFKLSVQRYQLGQPHYFYSERDASAILLHCMVSVSQAKKEVVYRFDS